MNPRPLTDEEAEKMAVAFCLARQEQGYGFGWTVLSGEEEAQYVAAIRAAWLASPGPALRVGDSVPLKGLDLLEAHTLAGLRLYLTVRLRAARAEAALEANGEEAMARWQAEVGDLEAYLDLIGPEGVRAAYSRMLSEIGPAPSRFSDVKALVEEARKIAGSATVVLQQQQRVRDLIRRLADALDHGKSGAEAEISRLRAALEPFASAFEYATDVSLDPIAALRRARSRTSLEDFRRARAALQSPNVTDSAHT